MMRNVRKVTIGLVSLMVMVALASHYYTPTDMDPNLRIVDPNVNEVTTVSRAINQPSHEQDSMNESSLRPIVEQLTSDFMNTLKQNANSDFIVENIHNKEDLYEAFEPIAERDAVKPYIDFFFHEEDGHLYIVPTELPPWFNPNHDFDLTVKSPQSFFITQHTSNELYGDYSIEIWFTNKAGSWKIEEIVHK
ncbi:hypothetical protein [Aureibacillus halotolerans]|uniref:DUF3993 domain-containing protein n=1 Tax=Aureibacillus halotolerans TaxID=1508390 RepID=A0A4R6U1L7_9BACI|nr:hypothetical protein [Aureibacillus halotolerans]TDQ40298.1 hypothetical protein EV213_10614 [Aureibacillus halotolerans]